jgi:glycosyltransferase involved in cell wall biosynthesis
MPGGGTRTQVLKTAEYLARRGIEVLYHSPWECYDWAQIDLAHVFASDMRNYYLLKALPDDLPLVVSPIIDNAYPLPLLRLATAVSRRLPTQILTSYKAHALALAKADAVIAPAQFDVPIFRAVGAAAAKIEVVHNGVELGFLEASPERFMARYGLQGFVLFVGQVGNRRKNLPRLLRVAAQMPHTDFVLVGPHLETEEARRTLALAARYPNVRVLGRLPYDELVSAYAACAVLALPSLIEGTGLVALEAALAGAQVVITRHGGPPDYFGDLAFYVEPHSEGSIRAALERALAQPADGRLRQRLSQQFTWEIAAEKLERVYRWVLEERAQCSSKGARA